MGRGASPFLAQPLPPHPDPLGQEAEKLPRHAALRLRHHHMATNPTGIGSKPGADASLRFRDEQLRRSRMGLPACAMGHAIDPEMLIALTVFLRHRDGVTGSRKSGELVLPNLGFLILPDI